MPKEFQDAVKAHKTGDIFFVDVSDRNWHYIVKKTFDDDDQKDATILRCEWALGVGAGRSALRAGGS
jgi:hypothetical protein